MANAVTPRNEVLEPLIGEWSLAMVMPGQDVPKELPDLGARVTFEWMSAKAFVLERWTVPIAGAPNGLAVLGWDESRGAFLQHYFDDRGVARVYEMSFDAGVWKMERTKPDFSPFDFSQRFTGRFSDDGSRIDGVWEIAEDHRTWKKDFDLIYTRVDAFIQNVHGVRYQVKDVARAVAFYTQRLGFKLEHQQLPAFASVSLGDTQILLSGPGASGSRPLPNGQRQEPGGWNRVVLRVSDLPGRITVLKTAGVVFRNEMETGPGGRQIQIEDPEGNPLELFEPAR